MGRRNSRRESTGEQKGSKVSPRYKSASHARPKRGGGGRTYRRGDPMVDLSDDQEGETRRGEDRSKSDGGKNSIPKKTKCAVAAKTRRAETLSGVRAVNTARHCTPVTSRERQGTSLPL